MNRLLQIAACMLCPFPVFAEAGEPDFPAYYPEFSWDRVPVFRMFGDDERLLTDKESADISSATRFLCIEKNHGMKALGAAELGTQREISRFKELDKRTRCLFYFNSAYAYPFTTPSRVFRYGKVVEPFRSFLIRDPATGDLATRHKVYFFDVLNPDFRRWWAETVGKCVRQSGADGLFVDQMHGFAHLRPGSRVEVKAAQATMMQMAKEAIGPDKILLLNNGAHDPELLGIGDAFMFEHYSPKQLEKEAILADWDLMGKISAAGKIAVWRIGVEVSEGETTRLSDKEYERISKDLLPYHLAVFLIGAQPHSYLQYGWGWNLANGALVDYPELRKPLGPPLGDRVRPDPAAWVFERDFEKARVLVDLESGKGSVQWR